MTTVFCTVPQFLPLHVEVVPLIKPLAIQFAIYAAWPEAGYLYIDGKGRELRRPSDCSLEDRR